MNWQIGGASSRVVPLLAFLLLETPLKWIGGFCHEGGHGLVALAQGGTFTGILFTQTGSYALANSSLVSVGGWAGEYVLAIGALLLYWKTRPKSFLGRSVLTVLIVQNLISEPPYIASLQGDSAGTLQVLEKAGIGRLPSIAIMEITALVLGLIGIYGAWRIFRTYLLGIFSWVRSPRAGWASLIFVAGSAAYTWFANLVPSESVLTNNPLFQLASIIAFLCIFSLFVIPPASGLTATAGSGPSTPTLAFIALLFTEALLLYYFALPITVPFP